MGQCLSLLLKQSPLIDALNLYDVQITHPLAMELNHIDTKCKVVSYCGKDMCKSVTGSKIVVVVAAAPNTEVMSFDKMFPLNAPIVKGIVEIVAKHAPKAFLAFSTNPLNSIIPMAAEILKQHGVYNPNTLFGITTADTVRANTMVAHIHELEPECVTVPVVGGNCELTMVPVLSKATPCADFSEKDLMSLSDKIRNAQYNISKLCPIHGVPLSGSFAIARFVLSLVKAVKGVPDVVETAFVPSAVYPYVKYMSTPVAIGPTGITKNLGIPVLSDYEKCLLDNGVKHLIRQCKLGEKFVGVLDPPPCDPCNPNRPECPEDFCQKRARMTLLHLNKI